MQRPMISSKTERMLAASTEPLAVVFPVNYNGVNFARALHRKGVNVVGLFGLQRSPFHYTRSCEKVFCGDLAGEGAIDALLALGRLAKAKPVLIPIGDLQVLLISRYREQLAEYFEFNIAEHDTLEIMIDKTKLYSWGHDRFSFPKTFSVTSMSDALSALEDVQFPVVFKPRYRTDRWLRSDLPKASLFHDAEQVLSFYRKASELEQVFVLSEFVEGPDSNLWLSHFYYANGRRLAIYTNQKIRQYPPILGTGAYCLAGKNAEVVEQTEAILSELEYSGIGAMEFKRDERSGQYMVMEPCCGRPSHHSYISLGEGFNLPYLVYSHLAGHALPQYEQSGRRVGFWDEERDLRSAAHYMWNGQLSLRDYVRDMARVRTCVHSSLRDPLVGLAYAAGLAGRATRKVAKKSFGLLGVGGSRAAACPSQRQA